MSNSLKRRVVPTVGLLWEQFAPYHVDRCEAVAERLAGRASVLAIEVTTASATYAWAPSGEISGTRKVTLFPGRSYDDVPMLRIFWRQFRALRRCRMVLVGISYARPDIVLLSLALRLCGVRLIMMTDSKFDDMQRFIEREISKAILFAPYSGVIVAGARQAAYVRFLGYRRRPVLSGYDTLDLERVRRLGGGVAAPDGTAFADRPFVFVGRFVVKKNIPVLLDAYQRYVALAGDAPRRLVLVGSGELEGAVRARIAELGLAHRVEIAGFLQADGVARVLASALALVLPSTEEQWGLVVNEAMAFNLPIIASENVGARDALLRNLVNGYVVEPDSVEGFARAMLATAARPPAPPPTQPGGGPGRPGGSQAQPRWGRPGLGRPELVSSGRPARHARRCRGPHARLRPRSAGPTPCRR